jgi:hypothetical protein
MKAAVYSRFSTDRQNESSIADQVRVCTEYAARPGWQAVELFEDQGISGAALGNRPGVLRLQEGAFARRFDVVLVTDLSRLSRSRGDLSKMIDRGAATSFIAITPFKFRQLLRASPRGRGWMTRARASPTAYRCVARMTGHREPSATSRRASVDVFSAL